ncbi:T9SS type A sorting domain-containing protein [Chryseobacterium capnotolerans]|uniref:zinc-dependent metalloprotease n=1 Tax=Chryseobacterium TaxID=59732 RepID=UPI00083B44A4|nr:MULTISPECIES: GEVED domain-containing protein [Chryseobacterium]UHO38666.1 T9SS type A sorting domain-containing protein [Chryseobacterium capnotolerans]
MKKTFLYGAALFSLSLTAQQQPPKQKLCGFDQLLKQQDKENPGARIALENIARKIQLEQKKNPSAFNKTVNGVYEIPVVVHVIEGGDGAFSRTNAQIQAWIENANKMYAGTYPWPSNGVPGDFGTSAVFPIKLVLAKRTPQCTETTGIVRYNGSSLPGYATSGMAQYTPNGATRAAIKNLAPHWPEASYFNIYLISMFDGDTNQDSGLMGFATFPNSPDNQYESFMKAGTVTNLHDTTFAHEFGHAMGLYHTFEGGDYQVPSTSPDYCPPTTGDCTKDDDMVCDTERAGAAYLTYPPTNAQINPCTQANYQGVQYNMMNYTNSIAQKFTPGQGDKINGLFMLVRSNLTTSKGATALSGTTVSTVPIAAVCLPSGVAHAPSTGTLVGPISVKLGQINNATAGSWAGDPYYYIDYTSKNCLANVHTTLGVNQSQNIQVGFVGNDQSVRVWIDYNNNGTFEDSELVASGDDVAIDPVTEIGAFSASFTPPASAVLGTPLRMRVLVDYADPAQMIACGQLNYGQAEDYSVTLVSNLGTNEVKTNNTDLMIYPNPVATGDKVFIKAKNAKNLKVSISDMAGRLVGSPSVSEEGNGIYKVNQQLGKGVYMIQVSNGKDSKTSKLIIK